MYLKLALKELKKSDHKFAHHGVVVIRGGSVVAVGFNRGWEHAEVKALKKLWPSERRGCKVVSVRLGRNGKLTMARPCEECEGYMRTNGVKKVYYTDDNSEWQQMKLRAE